jgi:hypothetical protein
MTRAIRSSNISTKGGTLAAIFFVAVFASVQVACLSHSHCDGAGYIDYTEESHAEQGHESHFDHDTHSECGHAADSSCEQEHQDYDIHHHTHDGQAHPKRRFTAPADETDFTDTAIGETPVVEAAGGLPVVDESPPLERYGLKFAERAPPHA